MKKRRPKRNAPKARPTPRKITPSRFDDRGAANDGHAERGETDQPIATASSSDVELAKKFENSIDDIVPDRSKRVVLGERLLEVTQSEHYRGPLPHPKHFEQFEASTPGAGLRIIKMAEAAQKRAEDRYDKIVANDYKYSITGMYLAAGILLMFAICGSVLCLNGQPEIGAGVLVLSGLSVIASKFIDGRGGNPKKNDKKRPSS